MTLKVLVLTPRGRGGLGGIDRLMDSLRQEAPRLRPEVQIAFATTRGRSIVASPVHMVWTGLRLVAARLGGRLDVVHVNLSSNASAYRKAALAWLCLGLGVPYVIHLHGADFAAFWPTNSSGRRRMVDRMFLGAARIVVLGSVWAQLLESRLPQIAARLRIVPNASPAPRTPRALRDTTDVTVRLLFLGELGPRKGVPTLLNALASLRTQTPWRAVLAGEGAVEGTRRSILSLGLGSRVETPGWVDGDGVARLLAEGDVLVLPSLAENQPLAVIEAMAAGLAVIATPVGATADIVRDGETGLLVQPRDAAGLASALTRLIEDAELRRRLGDAALGFHRAHLDTPAYADRLAQVWREASADGGGR